jgi:CHAD domain-containing protein
VAKARPIPGLEEQGTYAAAAAKVVAVRTAELAEHSSGVLDLTDIEGVHRMRVATRRLRAALEIFEPCFPRKPYKRALRDVKRLADALGERRDFDVAIEALEEFWEGAGRADRPGIDSLIARLRAEQAEANGALAAHVSDERVAALCERLKQLVDAAARAGSGGGAAGVEPLAVERIPEPLSAPVVPVGGSNGAGER